MCYSPSDATNEIKRRIKNGGEVVFIPHLEERMNERHIDGLDVMTCLRSGVVRKVAEIIDNECRYKVESNLNGNIAVVVEIPDDNPCVVVITTFKLKNKRN